MYLFVYKTIHKNGKFYIGRHETNNLNDDYLGSGKWIRSIKDKSTLVREIIDYADNINDLKELEEYYIDLFWNNPLCMNEIKGSIGFTSEDAKKFNIDRVNNGTHPFQTRPDGTNLATDRVNNGTHNWLKTEDGISLGCETSKKRVQNGTHHLLKRPDGTSHATDRVNNGTHNFVGYVYCINTKGFITRISKKHFYSQLGPKENWEWVTCGSNEGKLRKIANQS